MKLKMFKRIIDKTVKYSKKANPSIHFINGNIDLEIRKISQFNISPDVYIYFKKLPKER